MVFFAFVTMDRCNDFFSFRHFYVTIDCYNVIKKIEDGTKWMKKIEDGTKLMINNYDRNHRMKLMMNNYDETKLMMNNDNGTKIDEENR